MGSRRIASPRFTSPATPNFKSIFWTRTTTRSLTRSGNCTNARFSAPAGPPRCWNGTTGFRPLMRFMAKRSKPINFSTALKKNPPKPERQTRREFHELQRLMACAVMRPLARGDVMQKKWSDGRPTKKIAESFIKPNDRLTSFERLEIYNRQYWFRIRGCFYEDYPGLRAVLGDKKFERMTDAYLSRYPSQSYTLRNLGSRLIKFLGAEPRWAAPKNKLAFDLARLEWAHIEAFDNEARPSLKTEDLAGLDAARIRLKLQPH